MTSFCKLVMSSFTYRLRFSLLCFKIMTMDTSGGAAWISHFFTPPRSFTQLKCNFTRIFLFLFNIFLKWSQEEASLLKRMTRRLESKFNQVWVTVEDHCQRLSSLELTSDDLSQCVSELENVCSTLRETNSKLMATVVDIDGGRLRSQSSESVGRVQGSDVGALQLWT